MLDVAIICSVIPQRHSLLVRSIETWQRSIQASGLNALIYIWSEGCPTIDVYSKVYKNRLHIGEVTGQLELSGSHVKGYDYWLDQIQAKVYLLTHPELLFPSSTVRVAYETAQPNTFAAFKCFWLPQYVTENLETYDWQHPETLEQCEDIYKNDPQEKGPFYWNKDIRGITAWHSTTTYAMEHETLKKMLPFPDFGSWGADDPWHLLKRKELGIKTVTIMEPILMHQYHPTLQTLSIEEIVQQAKDRFNTEPNL